MFHCRAWFRALQQTYGYEPIAIAVENKDGKLAAGIPFCAVRSRLTGKRLVSAPFSDHCDPLVTSSDEFQTLLEHAIEFARSEGLQRIQLRPVALPDATLPAGFGTGNEFALHVIDLRPDSAEIVSRFHSTAVRKWKRALREGLEYRAGGSTDLLDDFFRLMIMTRRKHGLPPQPKRWFRAILDNFGENMTIRTATKGGVAVAAILTARWGSTYYYKYGCSDAEHSNLGGTALLFKNTIDEAKANGAEWFDMGRTDLSNDGLMVFKERWGAERRTLRYFTSPAPTPRRDRSGHWISGVAKRVVGAMPDWALVATGSLLYKHMG